MRTPYEKRAYEIFKKDGPMALLPMGDNLFQIILSSSLEYCNELKNLSYSNFLDKIATLLPKDIEIDALTNKPQIFPLNLSIPSRLTSNNCFLVGEAAHSIHPVGGQGLNLCLRDIRDIVSSITFASSEQKNINYWIFYISRYIDILSIIIMTHSLVSLFSNQNIILKYIRSLIFYLLIKIKFLRTCIILLMTDGINLFLKP